MNGGSIRKEMFENGWISRRLFKTGGISIDLYYLWINNVDINEQDPVYIKDGYLDNVTLETQLDTYVEQLREIEQTRYIDKTDKKYVIDQVRTLKAIINIKIEQSN